MAAQALFDEVVRTDIHPLLKSEGFKKQRFVFRRHLPEVSHLVSVQKSRGSTQDQIRFTVNLGVASKRLLSYYEVSADRFTIENCHWTERLGHVSPQRDDVWWTVRDSVTAAKAGVQVKEWLSAYGLPAMSQYESDGALRDVWLQGQGTGLTKMQRLINVSLLVEAVGPESEMPHVIQALEDFVVEKPIPAATIRLRELTRS